MDSESSRGSERKGESEREEWARDPTVKDPKPPQASFLEISSILALAGASATLKA